jgi:hypothetical protein
MDEEEENRTSRASSGLSSRGFDLKTSDKSLPTFGRASLGDKSKDGWALDGWEAFGAQRYFPPEPETGLEDNFFGIVKIVDDYLPLQQEPRSITGRNLMIKKRIARRWLVLILLCRSDTLFKVFFAAAVAPVMR